MNIDIRTRETATNQDASAPPRERLMLVRCARFTCLAFRDANGVWISYFDRKELTDVIEVLPAVGPWNQS